MNSALEMRWEEVAGVLHIGAQWGSGRVFNWRHGSVGRLQFSLPGKETGTCERVKSMPLMVFSWASCTFEATEVMSGG